MKQAYTHETGLAHCYLEHTQDRYWYLSSLSVHNLYLGKGYGKSLMKDVLADADRERAVIYLEVRADDGNGLSQEELVKWYLRLGFENCAQLSRGLPYLQRFPR